MAKTNLKFSILNFQFSMMLLASACSHAVEPSQLVNSWLDAQTDIQTWSADVVQTRNLKSLTTPLTARGRVWFAAPNRFRWEIGDPPQTIAVRKTEEMLVIYPRLKRAERFPLDLQNAGPFKD